MILYAVILGGALIYLFRREGQYITVTAMMFGLHALLYGFGHIYYYSVQDFDRTAEAITSSLGWMWCGLIAGVELCRLAFPRALARQLDLRARWSATPLEFNPKSGWLWRMILWAAAGVLAMGFVAFGKLGALREFLSLTNAADIVLFRAAQGGEGGYAFQLFVTTVAPFLAIIALLIARRDRGLYDWALAAGLCGLVLLMKLATFHKAQWIWFLIELGIGWYMIKRIHMRVGTGIAIAVVVVLAFMLAASFAYPDIDVPALAKYVSMRVFDVTNESLYQTYYVYPHYLPHTHGLNIGLIHEIYGYGELIPAYTQVARFFGSYLSTFNAMFIADAWVDFGTAGVIGVSVIIGFIIKGVDLFVAMLGKTPVALAVTAAGFFGVVSLSSISAFTSLLTGGLALLPLLVAFIDMAGARLAEAFSPPPAAATS